VPPLIFYLADVSLTLAGQPSTYWRGNYAAVQEINPLAHFLLAYHPLAFLLPAAAWAVVFCTLILRARETLATALSFLITLAHSVGAATWLPRLGNVGYAFALALLLGAAHLWVLAWRRGRALQDSHTLTPR
jgi:hypothetical protein